MLTKGQLRQEISTTISKEKVLKLSNRLKMQNFALYDLIDVTFDDNKDIAFRAAWILENLYLQNPQIFIKELANLIKRFDDVSYPSCQRHYAKMIMHITSPKAPKEIRDYLDELDLEKVIERLFLWIIDDNVKIAVKVFASEALFNMRDKHTWITEELSNQISYIMRNGTAAIQSRGKKLLSKLAK